MKKLMTLLFVAMLSGCAGTRIQREVGAPEWDPAPKSSHESERRASYERHKVASVEQLCFEVDGKYYGSRGMQQYYAWAQAREAGALLRQGRKENAKSAIFPLISIAGFAGASAIGYQVYRLNQPGPRSGYSESEQSQSYVATLGGLGLGALVGWVIRNNYTENSNLKRIEAAESFNRHLLKRLDFKVNPSPGGARASVSGEF